jgi:hypothetical protein
MIHQTSWPPILSVVQKKKPLLIKHWHLCWNTIHITYQKYSFSRKLKAWRGRLLWTSNLKNFFVNHLTKHYCSFWEIISFLPAINHQWNCKDFFISSFMSTYISTHNGNTKLSRIQYLPQCIFILYQSLRNS